jgi:hypothetical protein
MFDQFANDANRPLEVHPTYAGAAPDSDGDKEPAPPEAPYQPYAESSLNETPYEPYAKKPVQHEPPYEPYKNI